MRTSVERLRIGLLAGAGLLVVVIAAFLGYARYGLRRALVNLPGRLGATVTTESNGYTYSQSDGKKTIFTIHAAKAVQHTDGNYMLHDVTMVLYGKKGDRADFISGDDFEYDTKHDVVRAAGIVHLDLQASAAQTVGSAPNVRDEAGSGGKVIHVKTSGLVYMKTLGVAATAQGIDFAFGRFTGHAVGAEYDSETGHLVLQSAVTVSGLDKGRPVAMNATHGEFDRSANLADFTDAHYSSAGETAQAQIARLHMRADSSVERIEGVGRVVLTKVGQGTATSDQAEVALDTTNKPKNAILTGNVHFADDEPLRQVRGESDVANLDFDALGRLHHALLQRHVRTTERQPGPDSSTNLWQERTLTANDLDLIFAAAGAREKPLLRDAKATGSARLTTVATVSKPEGRSNCGNLPVASGRCSVTTTNKLSGDVMQAHFIAPHGDAELSTVHGTGHTVNEQLSSAGTDQISSGDTLDASFREVPSPRPSAGPGVVSGSSHTAKDAVELATAVQQGGIAITRTLLGKNKAGASAQPDLQHATARIASYDADANTLTLTGEVRMSETGSTLAADRVVMERDSGNATADGLVKATYLQACVQKSGPAQPVHILAARAEFNQDDGRATFYGRPAAGGLGSNSGLARLWQAAAAGQDDAQDTQGGSQIEAPVLVFEKRGADQNQQRRLTARAETSGVAGQVHAALPYTEKSKPADTSGNYPGKAAQGDPAPPRHGVARITSSQMVYSDIDREAVFTGGVRLLDGDGTMRAQQATIFLTPASAAKDSTSKNEKSAMNDSNHAASHTPCSTGTGPSVTNPGREGMLGSAPGILGGDVDRIVATQHVEITQPAHKATPVRKATGARRATGERLVYTASDQMYVLTGTAAAPPKVVDALQGTTTGAVLRFHAHSGDDGSDDDSVVVSGRDGDAPAQRVHTETQVKQQRTQLKQ